MGQVAVVSLVLATIAVGCTKPNPEACCETDAQCAMLGVTAHRPCVAGQACASTTLTCMAAECETSADCTSPDAAVCINRLCVGACQSNADCAGLTDKPLCLAATGQCVGCLDATTCPSDQAFCDADTHACRGCQRDDECASGVCVEADGVCATSDQLLFVSSVGADTGDCVAAPCASVGYALQKVTGQR
ncbi:MAG TPA: hypothetical protein VH165_26515, partial [Kofleriaceae bacterium]|nr:hypothetical protein [Kofleriaceae bacterium]